MSSCYSAIIGKYRKMVVPILVAPLGRWKNGNVHHADIRVDALIDTGATGCCLSPELIKKLKIDSIDRRESITADGITEKNIYRFDMRVLMPHQTKPNIKATKKDFKEFHNIEAIEFFNQGKAGMILGMDIILEGSLEIRGKENTFTFCL